jgi:hypothetical protein
MGSLRMPTFVFPLPCLHMVYLLLGRHASALLGLWDKVIVLYIRILFYWKLGYGFVHMNMAIFMLMLFC